MSITVLFVSQTTHPSSSGTENKSLCDTFLEKALRVNIIVRAQRLINKIQTLSHLKGGEITTVEPHVFFSSTGSKATHVCFTEPPAREGNELKLRTFVHVPPPRLENSPENRIRHQAGLRGRGPRGRGEARHLPCVRTSPSPRNSSASGAGGREKGEARGGLTSHHRQHKPSGDITKEGGDGVGAVAEPTPRRRPQPAAEQRLRLQPRHHPTRVWGVHGRAYKASTRAHLREGRRSPRRSRRSGTSASCRRRRRVGSPRRVSPHPDKG